jgi:hypothetical protein
VPERFFVVRVMKTGSTTLVEHLHENFGPGEVYPTGGLDVRPGDIRAAVSIQHLLDLPEERRSQIRVFIGHLPYIAYELLGIECATITILRDPIQRTISHLRHAKLQPRFRDVAAEEIYEDPFAAGSFFRNHQTKYFAMRESDPLIGIMEHLEIDEDRLALAKATLDRVDVVGLIDEYELFLDELARRYGWVIQRDLATNVSADSWEPSPALRRRIEADNLADIEFYEYARELRRAR